MVRVTIGFGTAAAILWLILAMLWIDGYARRKAIYEAEARAREKAAASAAESWRNPKWVITK